jgi:Predicted ATPase (AAA+ superfamily)
MDSLFRIHRDLLGTVNFPLRRHLHNKIDWEHRLIGIKGSRGVGKTAFLMQYILERYDVSSRKCLYINLDDFYFTTKTIKELAREFILRGGEVLLIDQIYKYPCWAKELAYCYDNFSELKIIFAASSVIQLEKDASEIIGKVKTYCIKGFSFREHLELELNENFDIYSLDDILLHHEEIATSITKKIHPLAYMDTYVKSGFYPFCREAHNFNENLTRALNMAFEVDVSSINQIEQTYIPKIRKLLYLLTLDSPAGPNISYLSQEIETSRATVTNYLKYLCDAMLINPLYSEKSENNQKPGKIYASNTNLLCSMRDLSTMDQLVKETFFLSHLLPEYEVNPVNKNVHFRVNNTHNFVIGEEIGKGKFNPDTYYAIGRIEQGELKVIPLWLFGFLY